jgi:hypothetical protein
VASKDNNIHIRFRENRPTDSTIKKEGDTYDSMAFSSLHFSLRMEHRLKESSLIKTLRTEWAWHCYL